MLVREQQGEIELAVRLPPEGLAPAGPPVALDVLCQVIEGVSHFLLLAYRAACDLPSTLLELELQAEVDKFALLALGPLLKAERGTVRELHARLYERACFAHDEATEEGQRYRLASDLAARFWARLGARMPGEQATLRRLRAFHRAGQADKIRLALAA